MGILNYRFQTERESLLGALRDLAQEERLQILGCVRKHFTDKDHL